MKKSEVIKVIKETYDADAVHGYYMTDETAKNILEAVLKAGLEPKQRDYIEHYQYKTDRSWEKE